jgi:hypothetical protein
MRFDYFVYLSNFLSVPAWVCAIQTIMVSRAERLQMKNRSGALFALVCSLGAGPCFASDTTSGQGSTSACSAAPARPRR